MKKSLFFILPMKVIVCIDEETVSKHALRESVKFTEIVNGSLTLVHSVNEEVTEEEEGLVLEGDDRAVKRARGLLEDLLEEAKSVSEGKIDAGYELLYSDKRAVDEILEYVENEKADHVFIGHRRMSEKREELFGSFAKDMISKSDVPITVVTN